MTSTETTTINLSIPGSNAPGSVCKSDRMSLLVLQAGKRYIIVHYPSVSKHVLYQKREKKVSILSNRIGVEGLRLSPIPIDPLPLLSRAINKFSC